MECSWVNIFKLMASQYSLFYTKDFTSDLRTTA